MVDINEILKKNTLQVNAQFFFLIRAYYTISNVWSFLLYKIGIFPSVRTQMIPTFSGWYIGHM